MRIACVDTGVCKLPKTKPINLSSLKPDAEMKSISAFRYHQLTEKEIKCCPICNNTEFVRDYVHEETYCNKCGLVLSSAVQYCGLEKVDNVIPFSAPVEARRGVHIRYSKIKTRHKSYRHNIPDRKLMIKGHK